MLCLWSCCALPDRGTTLVLTCVHKCYLPVCQVSKEHLRRAVQLILFNQIVVGIPVAMVVYEAMKWRGCSVLPDDLPTFHWALLELIICVLVEELCFYYSHR